MSNSGSGVFIAEGLKVAVPIYLLLAAIGHLEGGDVEIEAHKVAEELSDYLPRVPAAHAAQLMEGGDDDGVGDE